MVLTVANINALILWCKREKERWEGEREGGREGEREGGRKVCMYIISKDTSNYIVWEVKCPANPILASSDYMGLIMEAFEGIQTCSTRTVNNSTKHSIILSLVSVFRSIRVNIKFIQCHVLQECCYIEFSWCPCVHAYTCTYICCTRAHRIMKSFSRLHPSHVIYSYACTHCVQVQLWYS